eukprot:7285189-Prymnesium_polylepis.1
MKKNGINSDASKALATHLNSLDEALTVYKTVPAEAIAFDLALASDVSEAVWKEKKQSLVESWLATSTNKHSDSLDPYFALRPFFRGPPGGAALHEVVVGAWHVGTVLDAAASRGSGRGFATSKHDTAVNVNVDIQWWSGDRLFKNFANKPGTGKDFRMRNMPVMGYKDNSAKNNDSQAVFHVRGDVGIDNINKDIPRSIGYEQSHMGPDGTLTWHAEDIEQVLGARGTFPDPWDLPASVPMVPREATTNHHHQFLKRENYMGIGRQRGAAWWDDGQPVRQGRTHEIYADHASDHRIALLYDCGNKFAVSGEDTHQDQGPIVAHEPP